VGLLTAGFPCQPHSIAGRRGGAADERNLWPDTFRLIGEMEPGYVILENVPGILTNRYAGTVVGQLSEIGYDCQWRIVSAAHVGAPHRRERWWCLAANTTKQRLEIDWRKGYSSKWWANASERYFVEMARGTEPFPGNMRIRDDAAHWMDRLKALGNGIVPAVAAEFLSLVDFSLCSSVNSENDYYSNE